MAAKSLEERVQRLEDIHAIQNVMGKYAYFHTAGLHKETAELFALKTPGVRAEIDNWGVYEGPEGIQRLYVEVHNYIEGDRIGRMHMHALTTPVIEVAGDGKTAKAVWISPGHATGPFEGELKAYWAWLKYGGDFVKEDGAWKIWHLHMYAIFLTPYDKSWVEATIPSSAAHIPDELKADRAPTYWWTYSPTAVTENVPAPPEPYETFDEETAY